MPRLLALVLLLGFPADAAFAQVALSPAAPADSMRSIVTRDFELLAPSDEDLRRAGDDLRVAVNQFVHHLGETPKKMAFLLFRSAAARDGYDFRPFTRRGIPVVPVILPAKPPGSPAGGAPGGKPGKEAGPDPLSHEAGHRFFVFYTDHALAVARGGDRGSAPEAAPGAGDAPGAAERGARPGAGRHPTHEAMPDWLEEAVAGLCERPANQNRRLDFMRARLARRIPFAELLTMKLPAGLEASGGGAGAAAGAKGTGAAKGGASTTPAQAERAAIFQAEAHSLARFIAHREGARFIGTLAEGVIAGRTVGDVLNTAQHLLSKPEALEKQWLEWMEPSAGAVSRTKE